MVTRQYIRWKNRLAELDEQIATGATVKAIAAHFGCAPEALEQAMTKYGRRILPEAKAARAREQFRINACEKKSPAHRAALSASKKRFWADPANRDRLAATKRQQIADRPDLKAWTRKASKKRWDNYYAREEREAAEAADKAFLASLSPFERQLELVRRGAPITTRQPMVRSYDHITLGGIASGML